MGCTTSSPYRDYYLELERRKKVKCNCQCHKNGLGMPLEHLGPYLPAARDSLSLKADPRIPLTGRQIFLIKRSWKGISRNMCETGINMFLSLFEKNEEVLGFFQGLKSAKTLTELRTSKVLENHVKGVMLTIDEAITNLDDADTIIDMLLFVGKSHTRFKGFNPNVFWLIKDSFLLSVGDTLGDRYTAHMEDIYQKTIEFILSTLVCGFDGRQLEAQASSSPPPAKHSDKVAKGGNSVSKRDNHGVTRPDNSLKTGSGAGRLSVKYRGATASPDSPRVDSPWSSHPKPGSFRMTYPKPGTSREE